MNSVEKRIEWVDLLKGIAILWLILYHLHVFEWMRSPVPVFFFLSGLFFSEGKSLGMFVKKKAKALLVPLLFFFVLGVAASMLYAVLLNESFSFPPLWRFATLIPADAEVTNPMGVGAIWFLMSLFEIYVIYYLLRMVSKSPWWLIAASILLFLVSCITMGYYAHGSLFYLLYTFQFCIFFCLAELLREKFLFGKIPVWLFVVSMVAWVSRFVIPDNLLNFSQILFFLGGGVSWLISEVGLIIVLVWLCKQLSSIKLISESKVCRFMAFEGRNSLTILGVHMLIMGMASVLLKHFIPVGGLFYLLLFFIILIVCNICIVLFNRYVPFLVNHKSAKTK